MVVLFFSLVMMQLLLSLLLFMPAALESDLFGSMHVPVYFVTALVFLFLIMLLASKGKIFAKLNEAFVGSIKFPISFFEKSVYVAGIFANLITAIFVIMHGDHQVLYTVNSLKIYLLPFKLMALPAFFLAVARIVVSDKWHDNILACLLIFTGVLSGSRGLLIFSLLAIVLLRNNIFFFFHPLRVFFALIGVVVFLLVGYYREPIFIDFGDYAILTIRSISEFANSNLAIESCGIAPSMVFYQFFSVFAGVLDFSRTTYNLTYCLTPEALEKGYGIAVSVVGESILLFGQFWFVFYFMYVLFGALIASLMCFSKRSWVKICGIAFIPFLLYSARAELVYPYVFLLRAFIFVSAAYMISLIVKGCVKYRW